MYKWLRLQMHWGDPCFDGPKGKGVREADAIKQINIFPYGEGADFAAAASGLAKAGGLKAAEAHLPGHTQLDVFYKDADGQDRWHRLDPFWGIVVYDKTGSHIATWQEIKANPDIALKPAKTVLPWADRKGDRERFAEEASFTPDRQARSSLYTMDKPLYAGESYLLSWQAMPGLAFRNENPDARDLMTSWGEQRFAYAHGDFEKLTYGHDLLRPHVVRLDDDIQIHQAHGALLFTPEMNERFADSLYLPAVNVAVGGEGRTLRPARAGKPAELIYLVQTPYVIVDTKLAGDFLLGEAGRVKVSVARAEWRRRDSTLDQVIPDKPQWNVVWESGAGPGQRNMRLLESDLRLRGQYKFLVKVQMFSGKDASDVEVSGLAFALRFQEGMMALPRLLPGKNTIHVTGGVIKPGYQLRVTYAWDDVEANDHSVTHTIDRLPMEFEIKAAGTQPANVATRGIILEALHKSDKPLRQSDQQGE